MKLTMIALLALLAPAEAPSGGEDSLLVVFWNVENFFDWRSESRPKYWTRDRFNRKCDAVAKTMLMISDRYGRIPDIIALAEIENRYVLSRLAGSTLLRKLGYGIVHYDSPDHRGIDCALLYRKETMNLENSSPKHIRDSTGAVIATRDILIAEFGEIAVLVNHHPSKLGGKTAGRKLAMAAMESAVDSLRLSGAWNILAVGDFNDDVWGQGGEGTIKYNGRWEKIDGFFAFGEICVEEHVFSDPSLLTEDRNFGGLKPARTFVGPSYFGGISDHLPVVLVVSF